MKNAKLRSAEGNERPLDGVLDSSQFLNSLPAAILLQDTEGFVLDCNSVAETILDAPRKKLLARLPNDPLWHSIHLDGTRFPYEEQPAKLTLLSGVPYSDVVVGTLNTQLERRWLSVNTCRVVLQNGNFGVVSSFIDVTNRVKKERALEISTEANRIIMSATEENACLQALCDVLVQLGRHALVWIGVLPESGVHELDIKFRAGEVAFIDDEVTRWYTSGAIESSPQDVALRSRKSQRTQDIGAGSRSTPWRERSATFGLRSSVAIPFILGHRSAVLSVYDSDCFAFDDATVEGLEHIARGIEFGVAYIRSLAKTESALNDATSAINALRTVEQSLSQSEEWFRKLVASSSDMIVVLDTQGGLRYANRANALILGYEGKTQVGLNLFDLIHPDDLAAAAAHFEAAKSHAGPTTPVVLRLRTQSGEWRFIESVLTNFLDDPAIGGIVSNGRDVTERALLTSALETLTRGNQVLVHAQEEQALLAATCQVIVDTGDFELAWVGYRQDDGEKSVRNVAAAGLTGYLEGIRVSWGDNPYGRGPTGTAIRSGSRQVLGDMVNAAAIEPWRDAATRYGLRSCCVFPLIIDGETIGTLSIYSQRPRAFETDQVKLLGELADELSYGIGRLRDAVRLAQNEARIHEADQRFRLAFEKNMAPMLFVDLHDEVIAANDAACDMLGYTRDELLGHTSVPFTYADDIGITEASFKALGGENDEVKYVKRYIRKDGRVIVAEVSRSPARDAEGTILYFVISQRDITDVVQRDLVLAMQLQVSKLAVTTFSELDFYQRFCDILVEEGRYELAWIGVQSANEKNGVDVICAAGKTVYLDEGIEPWWGTEESAKGPAGIAVRSGHSVIISDLSDNAVTPYWRERAKEFGFGSLAAIPDQFERDRTVLTLYHRQNLAFDDVTIKGLEGIVREAGFGVTHVRSTMRTESALGEASVALDALTETQHALSESEQRFRLAFEHNSAPMVFSNLAERVMAVNDAFSELVGFSKEELQNQTSVMFTHPDDVGITEEMLRRLNSGEADHVRYEKRYRTKDGRELIVDVSLSSARDPSGRTLYYVSSERDITEERQLSAQLAISQRLEAIGTLVGGVAHDFNNLLMVIRGYVSILIKNLAGSNLLEPAKRIDSTVDEAASFVRQLLAYSRQQMIQPKASDLNEMVRGAIYLMEHLLGDDIEIALELKHDLPFAWVDPTQIQQVLINLISNARDAMGHGGTLTFRTDVVNFDEERTAHLEDVNVGTYAVLEVEDSGVGMDANVLEHIFEPYFTTKSLGTGLGLATVYGITKQSRGHLEVESIVGSGTKFRFFFPLAFAGGLHQLMAPNDDPYLESPVVSLSGTETILFAEDVDETRQLLSQALRDLGYRVLEAVGGVEALELARGYEGTIDVLVSDVVMPDLNGYELAQELLRERPLTQVILTSGYARDVFKGDAFVDTNYTTVQKPYHLDDIAKLIRQLLDAP